jgi:hypothetical protein
VGGAAAPAFADEGDPCEGGEAEEETEAEPPVEEPQPDPLSGGGGAGAEGGSGAEAMATEEPAQQSWTDLIEAHAFASFAYTFNVNDPDSNINGLRTFDVFHNNLTIDVAELTVMHTADAPGEVGFRVDLAAGQTIPPVASALGLFKSIDAMGAVTAENFDLQQAYVSWIAEAGDGLRIDAGKFVTWAGAEVIEGWDGYNDHYSRGFLFGWAIPFTHTGVKLGYPVHEKVTASAMLVNGWDVATDVNNGKTWGLNAAIAATDTINAYVTYIGGPEAPASSDLRHLVDLVVTASLGDQLAVAANVDFGTEKVGDTSGSWYGVAGYARYAASDEIQLAFRGELFADPDGFRTGVEQNLISLTATPAYKVGDHVVLRGDLRLDLSTAEEGSEPFDKGDELASNQFTIGLNALAHY